MNKKPISKNQNSNWSKTLICRKQVRGFMKYFSISFLWGFFKWFFSGKEECGFAHFPTFGLQAYKKTYACICLIFLCFFWADQRFKMAVFFFNLRLSDLICRFYFDFGATFVGAGMIVSHVVNFSLLFGAVLSYGVMWPLIDRLKGNWFSESLQESDMKSLYGYKVSLQASNCLHTWDFFCYQWSA